MSLPPLLPSQHGTDAAPTGTDCQSPPTTDGTNPPSTGLPTRTTTEIVRWRSLPDDFDDWDVGSKVMWQREDQRIFEESSYPIWHRADGSAVYPGGGILLDRRSSIPLGRVSPTPRRWGQPRPERAPWPNRENGRIISRKKGNKRCKCGSGKKYKNCCL